jgi:hypothetical protein
VVAPAHTRHQLRRLSLSYLTSRTSHLASTTQRPSTQSIKILLTFYNQYSLYGHIQKLAVAEAAGLKKVGIEADIYQYVSFSACQPTYSSQR